MVLPAVIWVFPAALCTVGAHQPRDLDVRWVAELLKVAYIGAPAHALEFAWRFRNWSRDIHWERGCKWVLIGLEVDRVLAGAFIPVAAYGPWV